MCGIAGATGTNSQALVEKMLNALKHRGPDGAGTHTFGDITPSNVFLREIYFLSYHAAGGRQNVFNM